MPARGVLVGGARLHDGAGPDRAGDRSGDLGAPPGSPAWAKAVHFEAKGALNDNESSRELVERWVGALRKDDRFRALTDSRGRNYLLWSAFCKDRQPFGLGYDEQAIDAILAEREERDAKTARERCRDAAEVTNGETLPEGQPCTYSANYAVGVAQEGRAEANGISRRTQQKLDRLARDFPDLHEKIKAGEVSVHRAAIEAGIVKPAL